MTRRLLATLAATLVAGFLVTGALPADSAWAQACGQVANSSCGVDATDHGDFHGLIMVDGQPSVLDTAARSGTQPGCGDCSWTLVLACLFNNPGPNGNNDSCYGATHSAYCRPGQLMFRLFLTTDAVRDRFVGVVCLGAPTDVVPVGDIAAGDVARYLRDVTPPPLEVRIDPPRGVPAGLPAYFSARPAGEVRPVPFGSSAVSETITIRPQRYDWSWGDGAASGWSTDPGRPYPDGHVTHAYASAGTYPGTLTTEWVGSYTIHVVGETFGPYPAIGTVARDQPFRVTVLAAHSTLVSTG